MGMTESSDALIVIVSEETGAISMAMEGKLQRFLDTTTLKDLMLQALIIERDEKQGGKKDAK
jgi:diadenylate cyclase